MARKKAAPTPPVEVIEKVIPKVKLIAQQKLKRYVGRGGEMVNWGGGTITFSKSRKETKRRKKLSSSQLRRAMTFGMVKCFGLILGRTHSSKASGTLYSLRMRS